MRVLEPLCHLRPLWPRVCHWLMDGVSYPLEPICDEDCHTHLSTIMARGNHKSTSIRKACLVQMLSSEVECSWQLLLPRKAAFQVPGAVVAPLGLVLQDSINELGEVIPKWHLTHDQSFNAVPNTRQSVNDCLRMSELTPCHFGRALLCHIHCIVGLRMQHPEARILQTKSDLKSAYCRLHYSMCTACQSMAAINNFVLLALCFTFGGAANPSQWSDVSELICDLANDIVHNIGWDPLMLRSPHQDLISVAPSLEAPKILMAQASALAVELPPDDEPKSDCYIDDLIAAFLERDHTHGAAIIPFVIHLLGCPMADTETLLRDDILSLSKFIAEVTPAQWKLVLGWLINTCRLMIKLPTNKHIAWTGAIRALLTSRQATYKELEMLLGCLNHAGFIIPMVRHFLGRLQTALYAADKNIKQIHYKGI